MAGGLAAPSSDLRLRLGAALALGESGTIR